MAEVYFYHLQSQPLEAVLPLLLAKSRERGWRALVRVSTDERMAVLDDRLWSFSDDSFLPHGTDREPDPEGQPILLTLGEANPNGAAILFLADGAPLPPDLSAYERVTILLDGRDEEAVAGARDTWRRLREGAHTVSYWQQDADGRWAKRG